MDTKEGIQMLLSSLYIEFIHNLKKKYIETNYIFVQTEYIYKIYFLTIHILLNTSIY